MFGFDMFKVFLYFRDLEKAKEFYRDILGFEEYRESEFVWQYRVTPDCYIGLVGDGHGYFRAGDEKPVMPAMHLAPGQSIEEFFDYLVGSGVKVLDSEVRMFSDIAKVFLAKDTEGHVLEFIQRLK